MIARSTVCVLLWAAAASPQTITERYPNITGVAAAGDINGDGVADFLFPGRTVHVMSGRDGALLLTIPGPLSAPRAPLDDDVDGDGVADLLLADEDLWVYSGRTGAPLRQHVASTAGVRAQGYGGVGDVDDDGVHDYGTVFPEVPAGCTPCPGSYEVVLISGATGADIRRLSLPGDYTTSYSFYGMGDLDGNGSDDWAIFSPGAFPIAGPITHVFSGGTHAAMPGYRFNATWELVPLRSDVDGDGAADYIQLFVSRISANWAGLFSGRTGAQLITWSGVDPVTPVGDWDGDGVTDLALAWFNLEKRVEVVSLPSGQTLFRRALPSAIVNDLVDLGDRDGDGGREFAISFQSQAGSWIVDPGGGDFLADRAYVEPVSGGSQRLSVAAPAIHAGKSYWILGTLSGTAPGVSVGPVTLPLNPDGYTSLTVAFPQGALLQAGTGVLGVGGAAETELALPPLSPALEGLTLHHAYLVLGTGGIDYASRAVPLALLQR